MTKQSRTLRVVAWAMVSCVGVARAEPRLAPTAQRAVLAGQVKERGTREPIAGPEIVVRDSHGSEVARTEGNAEGRFQLELRSAGALEVTVSAADHRPARFIEQVAAGQRLEVLYRVDRTDEPRYQTIVRGQRAREEVERSTLSKEEVQKIPGTRGDAVRAVTNLPGVARAPFDAGQLVIWGAAPGDSAVLVGGHTIPLAFHFGAGSSVYNSVLLERVDYLPGNFGVRYGRAIGGIIDLVPRAGSREGFHGHASLDFIDGSLLLEGPIGKGSFAIAGRRSLIDGVIGIASNFMDAGFTVAPRYYDYQAVFNYPLFGGRFKLLWYGSDDELSLAIKAPDSDSALHGQFGTRIWFHTVQLGWSRRWKRFELEATTSLGPQYSKLGLGKALGFGLDLFEWDWRLEGRYEVSKRFRLTAGLDVAADHYNVSVNAPYVATEGETQLPFAVLKNRQITEGAFELYPAAYLEARLVLHRHLVVTPGVRFDYFWNQTAAVDPRLQVRVPIVEETALLGGVGLYHQYSPPPYADAKLGNPRLRPPEALHASLGLESRPFRKWRSLYGRLTFFYKEMSHQAAGSSAFLQRDGAIVPELYTDSAIGRVFGLEVLIRQEMSKYLWGWISYTLSRSERQDHPGEAWRLFPYDQTHILAAVLSARLPWKFDLGARFRYVTGSPETPYVGALFFADADVYVPLPGAPFSTRNPDFIQLDLRIDKRFVFDRWWMALYVDVTNVTNQRNVEGYLHSYDYSRRAALTGLPIIPSLGIKGAF